MTYSVRSDAPPAWKQAGALPRLLATAGRPDLGTHLGFWGPPGRGGDALMIELERSGLFGRGGAGFPTAMKWATAAQRGAEVIVANATEGEPASLKDKTLLQHAPHLVIDGIAAAAQTVGAREAVVCLEDGSAGAIRSFGRALHERERHRVRSIPIRMEVVPPGYVSGEETALVNWLNGRRPLPTFGALPFEKGVGGRPTLVNNVETFAHAALVARFGADWFRALGTAEQPGTALITVSGDVARPAVYEIPLGATMAYAITPAGPVGPVQAVLVGGYAGTWVGGSGLSAQLLEGPTRRVGPTVGCGSLVVVGDGSCGLKAAALVARWMANQSAGQCGPCVNGLPALAGALELLERGDDDRRWRPLVERWLWMVEGRGACKHPDGTARMVRSALVTFEREIERHSRAGPCGRPAPALRLP